MGKGEQYDYCQRRLVDWHHGGNIAAWLCLLVDRGTSLLAGSGWHFIGSGLGHDAAR